MSWRPQHNANEHWCYCRKCEKAWTDDYVKDLPAPPFIEEAVERIKKRQVRKQRKVERSLKS